MLRFFAARHSFQCCAVDVASCLQVLFIRCKAAVPPSRSGVCYRTTDPDPSFIGNFYDTLQLASSDTDGSPLLLLEDFHFLSKTLSNLALTTSKHIESGFVNTCLTFELSQMITFPTRITHNSTSQLDLP